MTTIRALALFIITMAAIADCPIPSVAQSAPAASQTDSVSIHVSLQKSSYAVGEKPIAVLAMGQVFCRARLSVGILRLVRWIRKSMT